MTYAHMHTMHSKLSTYQGTMHIRIVQWSVVGVFLFVIRMRDGILHLTTVTISYDGVCVVL